MQSLTETLFLSDLPDIFTDEDLHHILDEPTPAVRYGLVKRALAKNEIVPIRRGLYILAEPYRRDPVDLHHLAGRILRPSYVSLESALSAHGWIPEQVVSITSCSFRRSRDFATPLGRFEYRRSPISTLAGVEYRANAQQTRSLPYLIASPLRALADLAHDRRNLVMDLDYLTGSMRIDEVDLQQLQPGAFDDLLAEEPRGAARRFLQRLRQELDL